ncbi:hypothetical protein FHT13_003215 [Xanthomonas arboricola]|nr:hypothetical protein [Xanthomonas arboricola]
MLRGTPRESEYCCSWALRSGGRRRFSRSRGVLVDSLMVPVWHHFWAKGSKTEDSESTDSPVRRGESSRSSPGNTRITRKPLQRKGFDAGQPPLRRVVLRRPKCHNGAVLAPLWRGVRNRKAFDVFLKSIALTHQRRHAFRTPEEQRKPVEICSPNLAALSGNKSATMVDEALRPGRVNQGAVSIHAKKLKRGVARPNPARLPVTNSSNADVEEASCVFPSESAEDSSVAELCVADYRTMRRFV